ncbi:DNA-directed RNA polymerase III subunit RPC3 [Anoplophora glabripennis]|uniref:DNA-directed RNA polymerase III subunit RPC3 n=1 Tax=Anoplophora glabripennis TaxID=217634 RepID=UPI000875A7E0|nr:DNA-directed RNA polymerase III subunit RPC3 [Anoplophora glabripennis]
MSAQLGKVLSLILCERFGPIIEKVGMYLFQYGTSPILYIVKSTKFPLSKVKESLCVLIKYRLVTFSPNRNENIANYTINAENVLLMLRYPKYINLIKKKFGDESEMIIEEILQRSYWTASEIILKVDQRLSKSVENTVTLGQLKDKFVSLVTAKYLVRMPYSEEDKPVPNLVIKDKELHLIPEIDIKQIVNAKTGQPYNYTDKNIYWTVNFDRFHQDMRDKIIVTAFTRKFDENAGELVKLLLQRMYIRTQPWADISNPVPILEIKDLLKKQNTFPQLNAFFDQYVNVIEQDSSKLIRKSGEASGGSFQIFLKEAFTQFAWEVTEQCVLEKFDSKAARIFRLVKLKKYIEPDQIQKLAMIPAKEAKRLSYQLLEENFLEIQELRKASVGNGPSKSFMLFYIKLEQVVRMILDLCYKTLFNIMTRRNYEREINKRIIDKKQRVDTIAMGMRAQGASENQLADIEEMITPPERQILESVEKTMKKLNLVELEIDDTIFLLQMYLTYE